MFFANIPGTGDAENSYIKPAKPAKFKFNKVKVIIGLLQTGLETRQRWDC
jgi:hypothetical protein